MSEFLLALKWLRKQSNLQQEISEIKDEESHQDHSVNICRFFLSMNFLFRLE